MFEKLTIVYALLCCVMPVLILALTLAPCMLSSRISREEDELPPDAIK